ncbi:MAG: hypothetical protein ACK41D_02440 [Rubricoccaceae bacterium]
MSLLAACATLFVQLWSGAPLERAFVTAGLMAGAVHVAQLALVVAARVVARPPHPPGDRPEAEGGIESAAAADTPSAPAESVA